MYYHTPKPFFRKSRQTWYVQVNGKQINLGKDREAAFQKYHQLMALEPLERQPVSQPDTDDISLLTLFDRFLEWNRKHRSQATFEWYRPRLQWFAEKFPDLTVRQLRPYHVQQWVDGYDNHSQTTTRNYMRTIKRCLKWARSQGYVDQDPIEHLVVPVGESREVFIKPEQFESILQFVSNPDLRDLMVVTYETGCRPQESLRLEIRHVDLKNQRWVFPRDESKGKKVPRIVYLSDQAIEITKRAMGNRNSGHVFLNSKRKPWTVDAVNCAIQRVRYRLGRAEMKRLGVDLSEEDIQKEVSKDAKFKETPKGKVEKSASELRWRATWRLRERLARKYSPELSLYALRHSWATNALQRGVDSLTVAILMGHRDPSMLARVYQHLSHNPKHMLAEARRAVASGE